MGGGVWGGRHGEGMRWREVCVCVRCEGEGDEGGEDVGC